MKTIKLSPSSFVPALVFALALGGCAGSYKYSATAGSRSPKPPSCDFQVVATAPAEGYEEIGVLEAPAFPVQSVAALKPLVAPQVCAAGGDLVIAQINGQNLIIRAIVLAKKDGAGPVADAH